MPNNATQLPTFNRRPSRRLMNPVASYLLSLAVCLIGYFFYMRLVVPWVEQPVERIQSVAAQTNAPLIPTINKSVLIPLLPAGAWELGQCKTLITSSGTVLFKDIDPQADGTLKLSPFTLITSVGDQLLPGVGGAADNKTPLALRTAEGASLTLNKPINEAIHGGAKIESARLVGDVDIYRPPSQPGRSDALYVLARNVQFDRHRIYTLDTLNAPVLFSYGPHKGRGRNLRIDLLHDSKTITGKEDFSTIQGASKLELAYLDQLRIVPSSEPKKNRSTTNGAPSPPPGDGIFSANKSPLEVSCKGPCVFNFLAQTVTLSDRVNVVRLDDDKDNLFCDQLKIRFEKRSSDVLPDTINSPLAKADQGAIGQDLKLIDLIAVGSPVVVNANSRPAKISADRLTYNAELDEFFGVADPQGNQHVTLVTPDVQYKTAQLRCQLATDNQSHKTLESLDAQGPGQLLKVGNDPDDELFASWSKSLTLDRTANAPNAQVLVVQGDTHVRFHRGSEMDAQRIDIKLLRLPGAKKTEFAVSELVASRQVQLRTPKLVGTTDRLTAKFPQPIKLNSHHVGRASYALSGPPGDRPTLPTALRQAAPRPGKTEKPAAQPAKILRFESQQVQISLAAANGQEVSFDDLELVGAVDVAQQMPDRPGKPTTLKLQGEYLRVVPQTVPGKYRLELVANQTDPSLVAPNVKTDDLLVAGQKINLDQVANKVWVEGQGSIRFKNQPQTADRFAATGGFPQATSRGGSVASESSQLDAKWTGGMIFDGSKIYFEQHVILSTHQPIKEGRRIIEAVCGQISVELNQFVNFENVDQSSQDSAQEILPTEIIFVDQPDRESLVFAPAAQPQGQPSMQLTMQGYDTRGSLTKQQSISAARVTFDAASENVLATGPGWVAIHQLKRSNRRSGSQPSNPLASFADPGETAAPIAFVRANFAGTLTVEGQSSQMKINDRVRTVYLPTDDWRLNIDPDAIPPAHQATAVLLTSQQMTLARWRPRESSTDQQELTARGNVRIIGNTIDLNSDRVSYNEASDLLVVNGTTRTPAKIRYRQIADRGSNRTSGWQEFSAEKFRYQVATQSISVDGVKKVTGNGSIRLN